MQSGLEEPVSREDLRQQKTEIKELRQKESRLDMVCQKKDRKIEGTDKALSTYATQVITLKKFGTGLDSSCKDDLFFPPQEKTLKQLMYLNTYRCNMKNIAVPYMIKLNVSYIKF